MMDWPEISRATWRLCLRAARSISAHVRGGDSLGSDMMSRVLTVSNRKRRGGLVRRIRFRVLITDAFDEPVEKLVDLI
jgi:hypothetical protein